MLNLADHVEMAGKCRIIRANVLTAPLACDSRDDRSKSQAYEAFFVFLAKTLFDGPMVPPAGGLGGSAWLKDGRMHYYCPTSDFQIPADFLAETGVVDVLGGEYRLPVSLEELDQHVRSSFRNLKDHDTMVAHALTISLIRWDEANIWRVLTFGGDSWERDSPKLRAYWFAQAKEELDLIRSLYALGLVELNEADGRYVPTPELNRVRELVV